MTDRPAPRRKVTGQIAISSSSPAPGLAPSPSLSHGFNSSPSNPPTRIRAKVDPSSLPTSTTPNLTPRTSAGNNGTTSTSTTGLTRPNLRSTPSSTSLRSGVSASSSRARSPAPPLPLPSPILSPGLHGGRSTPTTTANRPGFRATASQNNTPTATSTPSQSRRPPSSSGRASPAKDQTHTPTARIRSSAVTQNAFGQVQPRTPIGNAGVGGGSGGLRGTVGVGNVGNGSNGIDGDIDNGFKRPAARISDPDGPKIRAKVTNTLPPTPITPGDRLPSQSLPIGLEDRGSATVPPSPLLSPPPLNFDSRPSPSPLPDTTGSAQSPSFAQHAMFSQFQLHPTVSAPGSPLRSSTPLFLQRSTSIKAKHRRPLPHNPGVIPPNLPQVPLSPEMRTVDLPLMTPTRSREEDSRRPSLSSTQDTTTRLQGVLLQFEQDEQSEPGRLSGTTTVDEPAEIDLGDEGKSRDVDEIDEVDLALETEEDVKEAKTNRKIADLEITNASLLAINRSLEATKSKQRSEIMKLRRMLRESLSGGKPGLPPLIPSYLTSIGSEDVTHDLADDEEMHNPELDARWDRIADMVDRMKVRGLVAVEKGKEEIKTGAVGRVLDWTEIEGLNSSIGSWAGTPEPERIAEADQPGE